VPSVSAGLKTRSPGLKSGAGTAGQRLKPDLFQSDTYGAAEKVGIAEEAGTRAKSPEIYVPSVFAGLKTRSLGLMLAAAR
jgi:hypothetical protein